MQAAITAWGNKVTGQPFDKNMVIWGLPQVVTSVVVRVQMGRMDLVHTCMWLSGTSPVRCLSKFGRLRWSKQIANSLIA